MTKQIIVGTKEWLKKQQANYVPNSDENIFELKSLGKKVLEKEKKGTMFTFEKVTRKKSDTLAWNQGWKEILIGIWLTIKKWSREKMYKKGFDYLYKTISF